MVLNIIYDYKYEKLRGLSALVLKSIHWHVHVPSQTIWLMWDHFYSTIKNYCYDCNCISPVMDTDKKSPGTLLDQSGLCSMCYKDVTVEV